jgi:hypothetical protein
LSFHAADSTFDAGFEFSITHYHQFSLFPPGERLEFFILHYQLSIIFGATGEGIAIDSAGNLFTAEAR